MERPREYRTALISALGGEAILEWGPGYTKTARRESTSFERRSWMETDGDALGG